MARTLLHSLSVKLSLICLLGWVITADLSAQPSQKPPQISRTHSFQPKLVKGPAALSSGTLNIVAVRVEFQPDSNQYTTGTGLLTDESIDYLGSDEIAIDPLPHDDGYFTAHLEFTKNYFETVSGGQLQVSHRLLPGVIRLDSTMDQYSPIGETFTFEKIANLARETWSKVDARGGFDTSGLNPATTAFVIFHAGVGRDIQITGTLLDPAPLDIPSVYMSEEALRESLDRSSFNGFPIGTNGFRVTNSLIIPRTLSRRGEDFSGNDVIIQLSINGLLAANIGSHIGLPDLFNTEDGSSGIGRFGLMDGNGFLGYSGLFPPEPSAWEKLRMGWATTQRVDLNSDQTITLPASSLHQPNSVARHDISSDEYFLVENRYRELNESGVTLTIRRPDGSQVNQTFSNADTNFVPGAERFTELLEPGVVVNVSNYDWALPGGLDFGPDEDPFTDDDRELNGGILIWHIDEAVIRARESELSVNNNPFRRGVDPEEADGAQDIGRGSGNILGGEVDRGTAFDFWWRGNDAFTLTQFGDTLRLYRNRFGPDTRPSSASNSGAPSFFEFYNFSEIRQNATFQARRVSPETISPVFLPVDTLDLVGSFPVTGDIRSRYPTTIKPLVAHADTLLLVPGREAFFAVSLSDHSTVPFRFPLSSPQEPLVLDNRVIYTAPSPSTSGGRLLTSFNYQPDGGWVEEWQTNITPNSGFISARGSDSIFVDGTDQVFNPSDGSQYSTPSRGAGISTPVLDGTSAFLSENSLRVTQNGVATNYSVTTRSQRIYPIMVRVRSDEIQPLLLLDDEVMIADSEAGQLRTVYRSEAGISWPAILDLDGDGATDLLFTERDSGHLNAVSIGGASLPYFPLRPPRGTNFTATPLLVDIDGDEVLELLVTGQDSLSQNIYGYEQNGESLPNFPLYLGSVTEPSDLPISPLWFNNTLYAVSHQGDLKAWHFTQAGEVGWSGRYNGSLQNAFTGGVEAGSTVAPIAGVLVKEETYNWPNPANLETYIRYQLGGSGTVTIKVISLSGRMVYETRIPVTGTSPGEHRIDTGSWGSGAYLASVEANVNGRTERKLIKIAVVH